MAEVLLFQRAQGSAVGLPAFAGGGRLFADSSLGELDPEPRWLLERRVLAFLDAVGGRSGGQSEGG